jgi:predicted nucleic acid-binding Zn ribbon protein
MNSETCIVCGKPEGPNPKFCSKSCAAKYNNKVIPKRKPGGHCKRCGTETPKGKSYCEKCRETVQRESERKKLNIRSWYTPDGKQVEGSICHAHISKSMDFEASICGATKFSPLTKSGELLEALIGICFQKPEYLRCDAIPRYISLLHELRYFKLCRKFDERLDGKKVAELPLRWLSMALDDWIMSYFSSDYHPLMPCYALDTARFIQFHCEGYFGHSPESWRIQPLVEKSREDRDLFRLFSPTFKKEFTQQQGHILVFAKVPKKSSLKFHKEIVANEDTTLLFEFNRCYLSENTSDYYSLHLFVDDESAPPYDLMDEFCFTGGFLVRMTDRNNLTLPSSKIVFDNIIHTIEEMQNTECLCHIGGIMPANWITDVIEIDDFAPLRSVTLKPIPKWWAELD